MRPILKMAGEYPKCFDSLQQYLEWKELALQSIPTFRHCEDCLPTYQLEMKNQRRCENPEVQFQKLEHLWSGYLPKKYWTEI